ncbi:hypothetical protein AMS68_003597 [Peltaster fructicola]|uniref:Armadillo-like helical domain-containing protein n=1 Tax=Peltaster fructicola TaxID=286661 RepID=A0A6H0XUF1_9PEZI|nr:hypothetical protein AMS68_003597 [Peltaster fructicola]
MDITQSPLTQQTRPESFEPKVVTLYRQLFSEHDEHDLGEGFWRELFLLRPDLSQLRQLLEDIDADLLLHLASQPRLLLLNAIDAVNAKQAPSDENALETLTAFFAVILSKKYTNPSSDIIEVLAGLNNVDTVFSDLVTTLEQTIRNGRDVVLKQKAVRTALAVVAGGYQTALISYFIHRDFFPSLMKLVALDEDYIKASMPFLLIGLLADYDKFESASNSYRTRFGDFVNDTTMDRITESVGWTSTLLRDLYVAIQDDTPAGWSLGGTLSYVGLGSLAGAKPMVTMTEEEQRLAFGMQPGPQAAILLPLYDFVLSNNFYAQNLISHPSTDKTQPTSFSALLSFISYLMQHAYRTSRAGWYAYLSSLLLLVLVSEAETCKILLAVGAPVRLCRQRPPHLPTYKLDRPYVAAVMDIAIDGINHNLRKRLDATLYTQLLTILARCLSQLGKSQTKLVYHWPELWRSLLAFTRFLSSYADDIKTQPDAQNVVSVVVIVLSISLRLGEAFVPNAKDYDDLVYKLVESSDALTQLRDAYSLDSKSGVEQLIAVSRHYRTLLEEKHGGRVVHLSPREVSKVIKQGYESLAIPNDAVLVENDAYREAEHKSSLKKLLRVVLIDTQALIASEGIALPT